MQVLVGIRVDLYYHRLLEIHKTLGESCQKGQTLLPMMDRNLLEVRDRTEENRIVRQRFSSLRWIIQQCLFEQG